MALPLVTDFSLACNETIKPTRTSKTVNRFGCGHSSKEAGGGGAARGTGGEKPNWPKAACETQFNGHGAPVLGDTVWQLRQRLHRIASQVKSKVFLTD